MLLTQFPTTNQGKSRLNKENERRINNRWWAERGDESYSDLEAGNKERGERLGNVGGGGASCGGPREPGRRRPTRRQIKKQEQQDEQREINTCNKKCKTFLMEYQSCCMYFSFRNTQNCVLNLPKETKTQSQSQSLPWLQVIIGVASARKWPPRTEQLGLFYSNLMTSEIEIFLNYLP